MAVSPGLPSEEEVLGYLDSLSNWGRWGEDDQLGTLNYVTPARRAAATASVREGITVSCAWDIDTGPRVDQTLGPPQRYMLLTGQGLAPEPRNVASAEFVGLVFHGYTVTHIDGLSHFFWDGQMYNGVPADRVTSAGGATHHAITALRDGIVTRGVLLDVAATKGVDWLEPGTPVLPADLDAAEEAAGVRVGPGDVALLRTGYGKRVRELGPENVRQTGRASWHATTLPWLHERQVAVIGGDTACGSMPSEYPTLRDPVHVVGIVAMGLWLIDNCDLEALADTCRRLGRAEFLFVLSPLRIVGGTGSPANPLAVF